MGRSSARLCGMPPKIGRFNARQRKTAWAASFAVLMLAVLFGNRGFRRLVSGTLQLRSLQRETERLKGEEGALQRDIAAASGDEAAIERAARRELGYLKSGEVEYRFPPPAQGASK